MKKLSQILVAALCLCASQGMAYDFSALNNDGKTIYYSITSPSTVAVDYSYGSDYTGNVVIPASVTYNSIAYTVTAIGESAFEGNFYLISVTIPNSVLTIEENAFAYCQDLTTVVMGDSVRTIGEGAFVFCSVLTAITLPNSVTTIREYAFLGCVLLSTVNIGSSLRTIGEVAFGYCLALTDFFVDANNLNYATQNGVLFTKQLDTIIAYPGGKTGSSYAVPNTVTTIGADAFAYSLNLTSITLPNTVITIGNWAFGGCVNLTSITLPNSITTIGQSAFSECSNLTSITLPDSITKIAVGTFYDCSSLDTIVIPNLVAHIEYEAFRSCTGLEHVIIPNSVTTIGYSAFAYCSSLTSVTFSRFITSISSGAFSGCSALSAIYVKALNPPSIYGAFDNTSIPLHVPCGRLAAYQANWYWSDFSNMIDDITEVPTMSVSSSNPTMGAAVVTQANDCSNNHQAIISANANPGYRFIHWNDGNAINPRTVTVLNDTALTGIFATDAAGMHYLSVLVNDPAMGTTSGSGDFSYNTTTSISATPKHGYRFAQWNDGITTTPRSVTVTQDSIFMAIFEALPTYYVSIWSDDFSMGSVNGSDFIFGTFPEGDTIIATALPRAGYRFLGWNDGVTANPRTIIVTDQVSMSAMFIVDMPDMYHVATIPYGSVSGGGFYPKDTIITITAISYPYDFRFVRWHDGDTTNPRTITVTQDTIFIAEFELVPYYWIGAMTNNYLMGNVTGGGYYQEGETATLTATPYAGHRFVQWDDGVTTATRTIIVTQDADFTAQFSVIDLEVFHVYVTANYPNRGVVTGDGDYKKDSVAIITATANSGYHFVRWNDGVTTSSRNVTVTSDTAFIAEFDIEDGIVETLHVTSLQVYPNPAREKITIELPDVISTAVFTLYDLQGRALLQQNINNKDVVLVGELSAGMYVYSVVMDGQRQQGKLSIVK